MTSLAIDFWFDRESLIAGQDWDRERAEAQRRAELVVLVCSPHITSKSGVIQREINDILTLLRDKPLGHIYLISLRTEDFALPSEILRYHYIDLFKPDWKIRLARSLEFRIRQLDQPVPPGLQAAIATVPNQQTAKEIDERLPGGHLYARFFHYGFSGDYWEYVNAEITARIYGDLYRYRAEFKEVSPTGLDSDWSLNVEEFFRSDDLVSLMFFHFSYYAGAAHPNHGVSTLNIGGQDSGKLTLNDVVESSQEALTYILDYCDRDLKRQFLGEGHDPDQISIRDYVGDYDWSLFGQFNINKGGLTISFSPYDVLPYVFGSHEVYIPWEHLTRYLSETFVTRLGSQLLAA